MDDLQFRQWAEQQAAKHRAAKAAKAAPKPRSTAPYRAEELAGCIEYRKRRSTGFYVGVYNGEEAGMDTDDGRMPWSTVCEEHSTVIHHATKTLALAHARDPQGWCEECQRLLDEAERAADPSGR